MFPPTRRVFDCELSLNKKWFLFSFFYWYLHLYVMPLWCVKFIELKIASRVSSNRKKWIWNVCKIFSFPPCGFSRTATVRSRDTSGNQVRARAKRSDLLENDTRSFSGAAKLVPQSGCRKIRTYEPAAFVRTTGFEKPSINIIDSEIQFKIETPYARTECYNVSIGPRKL
jgi:hypothetical protein